MSSVILREFIPDDDSGFIYSTYPKGAYYGAHANIEIPKDKWFEKFFLKTKKQIENSQILIACLKDYPETIIGYSIITHQTLEFVFVKEAFRRQGIGTLLTKNKFDTFRKENLTNVGHSILEKHPDIKEAAEYANHHH